MRYTTARFMSYIPTLVVACAAVAGLMSCQPAHAQSAEKAVASENALQLKQRLADIRKTNAATMKTFCPTHADNAECAAKNAKDVARLQKAIAKEEAKASALK